MTTPAAVLNLYDKLMGWALENEKRAHHEPGNSVHLLAVAGAYRNAAVSMWIDLDLQGLLDEANDSACRVVPQLG